MQNLKGYQNVKIEEARPGQARPEQPRAVQNLDKITGDTQIATESAFRGAPKRRHQPRGTQHSDKICIQDRRRHANYIVSRCHEPRSTQKNMSPATRPATKAMTKTVTDEAGQASRSARPGRARGQAKPKRLPTHTEAQNNENE